MERSSDLFEAMETLASCIYSLVEEGYDYTDCIPEAVSSLIFIANSVGARIELASILSKVTKPVTQMSEEEAHTILTKLRNSLSNPSLAKNVIEELYASLISIHTINAVAIQQPAIAVEAT